MFLIYFRCVEFMRGLDEIHAPDTDFRHIQGTFPALSHITSLRLVSMF